MVVRKIYFDMDGVLADFDRGVNELCRMNASSQNEKYDEEYDALMWARIREIDHFYNRLDLMPGAKEMFELLYGKYGDKCEILTGIPKAERGIVTSAEDKVVWTRRMLSEKVKIHTVSRKEKKLYCTGPETILIDDQERTILEWRAAGGTGILHRSPEQTLAELKRMGAL